LIKKYQLIQCLVCVAELEQLAEKLILAEDPEEKAAKYPAAVHEAIDSAKWWRACPARIATDPATHARMAYRKSE
jgi:hypothetical protein